MEGVLEYGRGPYGICDMVVSGATISSVTFREDMDHILTCPTTQKKNTGIDFDNLEGVECSFSFVPSTQSEFIF